MSLLAPWLLPFEAWSDNVFYSHTSNGNILLDQLTIQVPVHILVASFWSIRPHDVSKTIPFAFWLLELVELWGNQVCHMRTLMVQAFPEIPFYDYKIHSLPVNSTHYATHYAIARPQILS